MNQHTLRVVFDAMYSVVNNPQEPAAGARSTPKAEDHDAAAQIGPDCRTAQHSKRVRLKPGAGAVLIVALLAVFTANDARAQSAPVILTQPANQTVFADAGQAAVFNVIASGDSPLAYQWYKNGAKIDGATARTFSTPAVVTGDDGASFAVTVSNAAGSVTSASALLTLVPNDPLDSSGARFQGSFTQLQADLNAFNSTINAGWNGARHAVNFCPGLRFADPNAGSVLVNPANLPNNKALISAELVNIDKMGAQAVISTFGFPMLDPNFFQQESAVLPAAATYQNYLNFLQWFRDEVRNKHNTPGRSRALKLVVECECQLTISASNDISPAVTAYCNWMKSNGQDADGGWTQYQNSRSLCLQNMAANIHPDYLIIQDEPDTEANQVGFTQINDAVQDATLVQKCVTDLQAQVAGASPPILLGAGCGTWQTNYQAYISNFCAIPKLDCIDFHIYPINNLGSGADLLARSLWIASTAKAAGKKLTNAQCWSWKTANSDLPPQGFAYRAWTTYSFWIPEDENFLKVMAKLAHYQNLEYLVPFEDPRYFTYLNYYSPKVQSDLNQTPPNYSDITSMGNQYGTQARNWAAFPDNLSDTGRYFMTLINPADVTVLTTALPDTILNAPYAQPIAVSGGIGGPYVFSMSGGALPAGMTLDAAGNLSGAPTQAGSFNFTIQAMDDFKIAATQTLTITVLAPPVITTQPTDQTVNAGQPATFTVAAGGSAPLSFQWTRNGAAISGATSSTYTTPATVAGDSGAVFAVTVGNPAGSVTSNNAALTVVIPNRPPVIASAASATPNPAIAGQAVNFSVAASDPDGDELTYAWDFGDGATGAGSSAMHAYANAGAYTASVTVADGAGASVASSITLNIAAAPVAMTLSRLSGAVNFTATGRDSCSLAGVIPGLPPAFDPTGQLCTLNVAGAALTFTLDAHGRGKSANGAVALKLKPAKRDKTTRKMVFQGGNANFTATLRNGAWAATWGFAAGASGRLNMTVTVQLAGITYTSPASVAYTDSARSGNFKLSALTGK